MGSTLLLAYKGEDKKKIRMWGYVDSSKVSVKGKYKILILTKNEDHQSISDIYYYYYDVPMQA